LIPSHKLSMKGDLVGEELEHRRRSGQDQHPGIGEHVQRSELLGRSIQPSRMASR
jgi:hypothetical protein